MRWPRRLRWPAGQPAGQQGANAPSGACDNRANAPPGAVSLGSRALDIIFLVERLESLVSNGRSVPLTRSVMVNREDVLKLIDDLRLAVPEEVRAAKRINSERTQILERSESDAEQTMARAQEQAAYLISEAGLTEAAAAESDRMLAQARADAAAIRNGADQYANSVLESLAAQVDGTLREIEGGLQVLTERREAYAASLQAQAATAPADANADPAYAGQAQAGQGQGLPGGAPAQGQQQALQGYADRNDDGYGRR